LGHRMPLCCVMWTTGSDTQKTIFLLGALEPEYAK
jgi:hypothetical protein